MSNVIVGHSLNIAQSHGQHGLGSIEGLNLTLLINTQNHRFIRRIQVQPDNIANLFNEEWIGREFEMFLTVGLNRKSFPDTMNRGFRDLRFLGNGSARPVRTVFWFGLQGLSNEPGNLFITD